MEGRGEGRPAGTPANLHKTAQLQVALREVLEQVLRPGFYGQASVGVVLQDGVIQTIRREIEQL